MVDLERIRKAIIALIDGHTGRIDTFDGTMEFAVVENPDYTPDNGQNPYIAINLSELRTPVPNKVLEHKENEHYKDGEQYQVDDDWWNDYIDGAYEPPN